MHDLYATIAADAEFRALARRRGRCTWALAAVMLVAYYGFILLIAFAPQFLAVPLGPGTVVTRGVPIGVGIILLGFLLTGFYVHRANGEFDRRNAQLLARLEREG